MEENIRALERKLNRIIDDELEKDISQIDGDLVMACCDGLLRMENTDRYMLTEEKVRKSINSIIGKKSSSVTKLTKPIKILLIAAIIAALLVIGSLSFAQYKYNIFKFSDHSTVMFSHADSKRVDDLEADYIPEGFVLTYENNKKYEYSKEYTNGKDFFTITKQTNNNKVEINTEYRDSKVTTIGGTDYIEFGETEHGQGIVWEKDGYQYVLSGNISSQELLKIAVSVS